MRIIAEIDLSTYYTKGKAWLFNTIKSLHKPVFEDDERIIFYFEGTDNEQIDEIKNFLDSTITELDIPNFFVIKKFSSNITYKKYADTRCALPWISVYVSPGTGYIQPCCIANSSTDTIKDYPTIKEAVNCQSLKQIRLDMNNHYRPLSCKVCYNEEDKGLKSYRMNANSVWKDIEYNTVNGEIDLNIIYYDVRLSNLCNFKCRTCSEEFSSSIASETKEIFNTEFNSVKSKNKDVYEKFYRSVLENLSKVEKFYFAGGEPLIMIEHYQILDALIDSKKYDTILDYNSNFSQLHFKNKSVIDYWNQFKNVEMTMSLDAMGKQAEYLRHGTIWDNVLKNIETIKHNCPHVKLSVASTWSIYNSFHLIDFQKFLIENEIVDKTNISFLSAYGEYNSISLLPDNLKTKLKEKIADHVAYLEKYNLHNLINTWKNSLIILKDQSTDFFVPKFLNRVRILDQQRNENFFNIFPELATMKNHD